MHLCDQHRYYDPIIRQIRWNRWAFNRTVDIWTPWGVVRIFKGFDYNRDSIVPNGGDFIPSAAHDFLCRYGIFADGSPCSREVADKIYRWLNQESHEPFNRYTATHRYWGVRLYSQILALIGRDKPKPLPGDVAHLYGLSRQGGTNPRATINKA